MSLNKAFGALADDTRRALVTHLARQPDSVERLARPFAISRPAISRHLKVLREAGLIEAERRGRRQIYHLTPEAMGDMRSWLDEVSTMWQTALSSLKEFTEQR